MAAIFPDQTAQHEWVEDGALRLTFGYAERRLSLDGTRKHSCCYCVMLEPGGVSLGVESSSPDVMEASSRDRAQ